MQEIRTIPLESSSMATIAVSIKESLYECLFVSVHLCVSVCVVCYCVGIINSRYIQTLIYNYTLIELQ